MPKITILPHHEICPEGTEVELEAGSNLCKALLEKGIKIEHACEMSNNSSQKYIWTERGFNTLDEMDDVEADLLDRAWGLEPDSRLSCQVMLENDDLTIEIPKYTLNHAKENH